MITRFGSSRLVALAQVLVILVSSVIRLFTLVARTRYARLLPTLVSPGIGKSSICWALADT